MAGGAFQSIAHGNFVVVDPPHERPLRQDLLDELLGIVSARRHFFRPGVEPEREPTSARCGVHAQCPFGSDVRK
jgi:hypothetical protein